MRTSVAGAAVLVAAAVLAPVTTATAAGETCNGLPATLVGTLGGTVTGTEGRDVVVTGGASRVSTLGGDDLVCVTNGIGVDPIAGGPAREPVDSAVDAGAGDDVVITPGDTDVSTLVVVLGAGSDRFEGSATSVTAGSTSSDGVQSDTEADTLLLGPLYGVEVVSGQPGAANGDVVRLSNSGTVAWYGPMAPGAEVAGSPAVDVLLAEVPAGTVTADVTAGTLGDALRWSDFEDLELTVAPTTTALTVAGSAGRDVVTVRSLTRATRLDVSLGSGTDMLTTTTAAAVGSTIDGGGDRDRLEVEATGALRIDLARHSAGDLAVRGFEDVEAIARTATVRGDARGNRLEVATCRVAVSGRGGADQLLTVYDYPQLVEVRRCSPSRTVTRMDGGGGNDRLIAQRAGDDVLRGGAGNDRLIGGRGDDTLLGGAGRDRIIGGVGRDECEGERVNGCERQR